LTYRNDNDKDHGTIVCQAGSLTYGKATATTPHGGPIMFVILATLEQGEYQKVKDHFE